ncbi:MAG: hypothetical protein NVSMB60_20630 [Mycobacterium sp.]
MDFFSHESHLASVIDPQVFVRAPEAPAGTGPQKGDGAGTTNNFTASADGTATPTTTVTEHWAPVEASRAVSDFLSGRNYSARSQSSQSTPLGILLAR